MPERGPERDPRDSLMRAIQAIEGAQVLLGASQGTLSDAEANGFYAFLEYLLDDLRRAEVALAA